MLDIRPARFTDALHVGANLRAEDAAEAIAATSMTPIRAVMESRRLSRICRAMRYTDGVNADLRPLAIFGVTDDPHMPEYGNVWLLGTPDIRKVWLALIKATPQICTSLSAGYSRGLHAHVDARNLSHLRWLELTGFVRTGMSEYSGYPFIHVVRNTP